MSPLSHLLLPRLGCVNGPPLSQKHLLRGTSEMTLGSLCVLQKLQNLIRTCRCPMSGLSSLPRCVLSQLLGLPPLRAPISGQDSDQYGRLQGNRSASWSQAPPNRHGAGHAAAERPTSDPRPLAPHPLV